MTGVCAIAAARIYSIVFGPNLQGLAGLVGSILGAVLLSWVLMLAIGYSVKKMRIAEERNEQ